MRDFGWYNRTKQKSELSTLTSLIIKGNQSGPFWKESRDNNPWIQFVTVRGGRQLRTIHKHEKGLKTENTAL